MQILNKLFVAQTKTEHTTCYVGNWIILPEVSVEEAFIFKFKLYILH